MCRISERLVWSFTLTAFLVLFGATTSAQAPRRPKALSSKTSAKVSPSSFGAVPLHFEENRGQTDSRVQYIARGGGYNVFLTPSETVFALRSGRPGHPASNKKKIGRFARPDRNDPQKISVLRMKLSGSNPAPVALPTGKLPGTVNYFVGRDSRKWRSGIPTFSKVQYLDVYSGIDMVYYGRQNQLEYDFIVNPGADPRKIAFSFEGATALAMASTGEMHLDSPAGRLTAQKPSIYQLESGKRKQVSGNFVLRDSHTIGVDVKDYDRSKPLVIDPVLSYSTYLGGSSSDEGDAIAVDQQGNAYIAGDTTSIDFPISGTSISPSPSGTTIAFVSKLNSAGTALVYSTYIGGTTSDVPFDLAVDANGNAYVTGLTSSADFPVTSSAYQSSLASGATQNVFVSKLAADGVSLPYSTYLGGGADDEGTGIAVDASGTAYVSGYASSAGFPVTSSNAYQTTLRSVNGNAFLARIDTTKSGTNSLVYSTFLGGTSPSAFADLNAGDFGGDSAYDVAVDSNQNAYIVGEASSTDFPVTSGAFQSQGNASNCGFVSQIDTSKSGSASLVYSTYLCGTNNVYGDYGTGIAIDPQNNIYVVGNSSSTDFPSVVGTSNTTATQKPFVAKLNTSASGTASVLYAMRFGGSADDNAFRIACDSLGVAYVTGNTLSTDFPVTPDAMQPTNQNPSMSNGFLAAVNPPGTGLLYATYVGGSSGDGDYVLGVAVDSSDNVYLTGATSASDFPTTSGAFQTATNGSTDAFVTVISGIVTNPEISTLFPPSGHVGTPVTIRGSSFGASRGSGRLVLGTLDALIVSWSDTQIVALVAPNSASGAAQVLQSGNSSNSVNFTVTTPKITSISPTSGVVGTQVTITGSGFGASQGNGVVVLGSNNGLIVSWSATQIIASVAPYSTSGGAQVVQSGVASNAVAFSLVAPTVTNVSPTNGVAGTQVSISGTGFGDVQGSGSVLIGTAAGSVVSWSDSLIVATVATGSTSGSVQVRQGGVWSNLSDFSVNNPVITSVNPPSAVAGTQVTISGFYFGSAQSSGQVWLGTAYGSVVSWNDNQVVATVAPGSLSGKAQILQNGVWSNTLSFSTGVPQISNVNPASGTSGTIITITGSNFGSSQASGDVVLGNMSGQVISWSDTQITTAVSSGSKTGIVRITQNGVASNTKRFVVPTVGSGNNVSLVPYALNLLMGETHAMQALDSNNQSVSGLNWTSSDTTVVALSTDDPPLLTAIAPGHAVITAADSSADVTVSSGFALVPGTVIWSVPGDGSGIAQTVPAVPSPTGVADVFALQASGNVQAVSADGTVAWTAIVGSGNSLLPDFQGGLVVAAQDSVKRFDGITGQQVFSYNFANPGSPGILYKGKHPVAVHTDGTIFAIDGNQVLGFDPQSSTPKFAIPLENGTLSFSSGCSASSGGTSPPYLGPLLIAGNGYLYFPYQYQETQETDPVVGDDGQGHPVCAIQRTDLSHLRLIRVGTDGSVQKTVIGDWSGYLNTTYTDGGVVTMSYPVPEGNFESILTNADKGVFFTWSLTYPEGCSYTFNDQTSGCFPTTFSINLLDTSTGATANTGHNLPAPVLQAQDGTLVGNLIAADDFTASLAGFNSDGSVKWAGPANAQSLYTTSDGNTIARLDSGQFVSFDQSGNAVGQYPSLPMLAWMGAAYQTSSGLLDSVALDDTDLAETYASIRGPVDSISGDFLENGLNQSPSGNASGNGSATKQNPYPRFKKCVSTDPNALCPYDSLLVGLQALELKVGGDCVGPDNFNDCAKYVFSKIGSAGDQQLFSRFIDRRPGFFDGTRSTLLLQNISGDLGSIDAQKLYLSALGTGVTVADVFAQNPGVTALAYYQSTTAQSATARTGLKIFFRPSSVCVDSGLSSSSCQIVNQAEIFHEGLHEFYGIIDRSIQTLLGIKPSDTCTDNIDWYIKYNVFYKNTFNPCGP